MKKIYINISILAVLFFGCEEKPDYLDKQGPFATFYPETVVEVLEPSEDEVTITIASTGNLISESNAYVKIPADGSFVTSPAYDPFTKILKVPISAEQGNGTFTVQYKDNGTQQEQAVYKLEIVEVDGDLNGIAGGVFQFKVVEDDYSIEAPFEENFNNSCSNDNNGNEGLPLGWNAVSRASDYIWRCSGANRGATGEDGDYAIEMSNFGSPDGGGADDWLITPQIDLSNSSKVLSFSSMLRYEGSTMEVLYSEDYVRGQDPINATWVNLTAATNAFDSNTGSFDFVNSGNIDISALPDKVYIAVRFISTGAGSGQTGTARVDNFIIK